MQILHAIRHFDMHVYKWDIFGSVYYIKVLYRFRR